jgi:hypothetical protein
MKTTTNTNTTPVTTADTTATTVMDVAGAGAISLLKTFAGLAVGAVATAVTAKVLKTGTSQKAYEELLKEFTSK